MDENTERRADAEERTERVATIGKLVEGLAYEWDVLTPMDIQDNGFSAEQQIALGQLFTAFDE